VSAALMAALGGAPRLDGAACRGQHRLFDAAAEATVPGHVGAAETAAARVAALALCRTCPALAACAAYYDRLPPRLRPAGVMAGQLNVKPPKKSTTRQEKSA
jgi:hypothetical protein